MNYSINTGMYKVSQIKQYHLSFLLVTIECMSMNARTPRSYSGSRRPTTSVLMLFGLNVDTLTFHNHGGLAFIYRQSLKLQKRNVDAAVTTFEFLCGFASTASCHFILLGVYRPGSQALLTTFFDDLSAVFDQLARCTDTSDPGHFGPSKLRT